MTTPALLPTTPLATLPAPANGWIDLPTAAKRSGKSIGHLRRWCGSATYAPGGVTLQSKGLAKLVTVPGAKPEWILKEEADPSFAAVKFADQLGTNLRGLTDRQRQTAQLRRLILDKWSEAVKAGFTLGFDKDKVTGRFVEQLFLGQIAGIPKSIEVCRRTLYRWEGLWDSGGLAALADGRGGGKVEKGADPFIEAVKHYYLSKRQLPLTTCHKMACLDAAEKGWEVPSRRTCQRAIDGLPKGVVIKQRFGEEAYTNEAQSYIERDYSGLRSNQIWVGDHHQFDVICRHGDKLIRPWLTAWMDMRSRKIVGRQVFAHDPNSDTILSALRMGCLDAGVPETVMIDNGKDYDSYALNGRTKKDRWLIRKGKIQLDPVYAGGVFAALGIEAKFVLPYHGQSKPIERFFGTVEQQTPVWATYCGRSTAHKPEDLELQLDRGNAPQLTDFIEWFSGHGGWIETYHNTVHTGDGMDGKTPNQVFAENLSCKRTTTPELLDVLLLKPTPPLKVGQNGVTWQGLRYGQHCPELIEMLGREVLLRVDDRDLSRVQVWTKEGRFVCVAPANERVPVNATSQELRKAIAATKSDRKLMKDFVEAGPRMADDLPDKILRARARVAAAVKPGETLDLDTGEVSLKPVRSPLEDQLPALQKALEARGSMRMAVGAENVSEDPMADLKAALQRREEAEE